MSDAQADDITQTGSAAAEGGAVDALPMFDVTYYSDPLCCWCWTFEPVWQRLRQAMGPAIRYRYRMAGMIRDWNSYDDPLNSVHRPAQMGPLCAQVRHMTGTKINDTVWIGDPPASSWPACMAVKAAQLQSPEAAEVLLGMLREALMLHGRNIARQEVLRELADAAAEQVTLDVDRLHRDMNGAEVQAAFREDLGEIAFRQIGRFPALAMRREDGRGAIMVGYRPWEALKRTVETLWPDVQL